MTISLLAFMGIGTTELVIVAIIVLILFGSRLPTVMGSLGKGIRDFKKGMSEEDDLENNAKKPIE